MSPTEYAAHTVFGQCHRTGPRHGARRLPDIRSCSPDLVHVQMIRMCSLHHDGTRLYSRARRSEGKNQLARWIWNEQLLVVSLWYNCAQERVGRLRNIQHCRKSYTPGCRRMARAARSVVSLLLSGLQEFVLVPPVVVLQLLREVLQLHRVDGRVRVGCTR